jgi:hypothetical protein
MTYIISRFNHDLGWLKYYTNDFIIYDRSENPIEGSIVVPNIGTDIYDKFTYIIDNYDNLPDIMVLAKANLFKYITQTEFDLIKDNKTFTPLLTQNHRTYSDNESPVCWYENGIYCERNDYFYLIPHPCKSINNANELKKLFKMDGRKFNAFAPGSNYIVPKENILKHSKEFYIKLRSYLDWAVYPGEAQLIERGLYYLWS